MLSSEQLIQRVQYLEATLVWEEYKSDVSKSGNEWRLYSTDTTRYVASISLVDKGWRIADIDQYPEQNPTFKDVERAKEYAKYNAIRNLLENDIRTRYTQ